MTGIDNERVRRKYGWALGSIIAIAIANFLVTLTLIFFDYGNTIQATESGAVPTRSPLLVFLFYVFAPLLAISTRMGWPLPPGPIIVLNSILWGMAIYFLIVGIAQRASRGANPNA